MTGQAGSSGSHGANNQNTRGAGGFGGSGGTGGNGGKGGAGGAGGNAGGGGGGLGAGGDIFIQTGGSLTITGGTLANGSVTGGTGSGGAGSGQGYGSGIFIEANQSVTFGTGQTGGQTTTINGVITDQTGSDNQTAGHPYASNPGTGSVIINGAGTVVLGAHNTYTGDTTVQSGTLSITANDGIGTNGKLTLDNGTAVNLTGVGTFTHTIVLTADPTIEVDSGTTTDTSPITDNGGTPGELVKTGAGTLVLNPTGGSNSYSGGTTIQAGILELGSATAAGSGVITFNGTATLAIDGTTMPTNVIDGFAAGIGTPPGGNIIVGGGNSSGNPGTGNSTSSFVPGDDIDLKSVANVAGSHVDMDYVSRILTVTEGSNQYHIQFDPTQSFAGEFFHLASDNNGNGPGTDITADSIACYCPGTLIRMKRGEKKVEKLRIGDEVMTMSGALRPIKWIGRRSYGGRFILGRADILPICIKAGALEDCVPRRDLWISPHHAMYL
ncbi:MAG TPA: Hint domain-containing protein, partial [Bradyrhizobium sp.]